MCNIKQFSFLVWIRIRKDKRENKDFERNFLQKEQEKKE